MGINEKLGRFRLRLRRAWKVLQGIPEPISDKIKREPATVLRSDALEREIIDDAMRDIQEQCAELDDAMRGGNGHEPAKGDDYDETQEL